MKLVSLLTLVITFLAFASPAAAEKPLTFSSGAGAMSITADIAIAKGFIKGSAAKMNVYKNGIDALNVFLDGKVDIGTTSPNTIIFSDKFDPEKHAIVGTVSYTDSQLKLLTRNASGITKLTDIKGKRIGVIGAFDHFALYKLLNFNGISQDQVTIVTLKKKQMPLAISAGKVDAVFQHGKPIEESKKALNKDGWKIFQSDNLTRKLLVLMMNREMIANNPEQVGNVLKGILKAQDYMKSNPKECVAIVAKSKKYPTAKAKEAIEEITYDLMLRQSLLLSMETMETWAMDNGFVQRKTPRNYFKYIDPAPLKKVAPDVVTLIH